MAYFRDGIECRDPGWGQVARQPVGPPRQGADLPECRAAAAL